MLGATRRPAHPHGIHPVSILSQLRCWEQQSWLAKYRLKLEVSILSQLRCWEQRQQSLLVSFPELFQSSPSLGAGSNMALSTLPLARYVSILSQLRCWEQQLRQLGQYFIQRVSILSQLRCWSNDSTRDFEKGFFVSILSQLRCWEQPPLMCELVPGFLFQSSPSLGARSNKVPPCPLVRASGFNPLPA